MKNKLPKNVGLGHWCFAIVNGKLAEIYFEIKKEKPVINSHCYVKREEFKTKHEQKMIDDDTKKYHFTWQKGIYKNKSTNK